MEDKPVEPGRTLGGSSPDSGGSELSAAEMRAARLSRLGGGVKPHAVGAEAGLVETSVDAVEGPAVREPMSFLPVTAPDGDEDPATKTAAQKKALAERRDLAAPGRRGNPASEAQIKRLEAELAAHRGAGGARAGAGGDGVAAGGAGPRDDDLDAAIAASLAADNGAGLRHLGGGRQSIEAQDLEAARVASQRTQEADELRRHRARRDRERVEEQKEKAAWDALPKAEQDKRTAEHGRLSEVAAFLRNQSDPRGDIHLHNGEVPQDRRTMREYLRDGARVLWPTLVSELPAFLRPKIPDARSGPGPGDRKQKTE